MIRRRLGRSDIAVAPWCFGGNVLGWTADRGASFALLDAFVGAGFDFIDTADIYSKWAPGHVGGESEAMIGEWLASRGRRDRVVIATKVGMGEPGRAGRLDRAHIEASIDASLRRLRTDHVDLYQSHADDPDTPVEETLAAYAGLVKAGKVRILGASNFTAERLRASLDASREHGLPRYETLQPEYNLSARAGFEDGLQGLCAAEGVGVIPYYALAAGFLTGKYRSEADFGKSPRGASMAKRLDARGHQHPRGARRGVGAARRVPRGRGDGLADGAADGGGAHRQRDHARPVPRARRRRRPGARAGRPRGPRRGVGTAPGARLNGLNLSGSALLFAAGLWAGTQNALAGGGSFVTLPALILSGLDARAANITSTIALFPGQLSTGFAGRANVLGAQNLSFRALLGLSLVGGAVGGLLLLVTPASFFARLVPWLVLFATAVFAYGSFFRGRSGRAAEAAVHLSAAQAAAAQFAIAIYGGYFGGGIGFLMLAALTMAGLPTRNAGASKNVLAGVMNAAAVAIFAFSPAVAWLSALVLGTGAVLGGLAGAWMLSRIDERLLRIGVVGIGVALTVGLFLYPV